MFIDRGIKSYRVVYVIGLSILVLCLFERVGLSENVKLIEKKANYKEPFVSVSSFYNLQLFSPMSKPVLKKSYLAPEFGDIRDYQEDIKDPSLPCRLCWNSGTNFEIDTENVHISSSTRTLIDWNWSSGMFERTRDAREEVRGLIDNVRFRYTKLTISGQIYKNLEFKMRYRFTEGFKDVEETWFAFDKIPYLGTLKVGQFAEPIGSSFFRRREYCSFISQALDRDILSTKSVGVMVSNKVLNDRLSWEVGAFRLYQISSDTSKPISVGYAWTDRILFAPWMKGKDKQFKLGVFFSKRSSLREVSESDDYFYPMDIFSSFDNGESAESLNIIGTETHFVYKRFAIESEYMQSMVEAEEEGAFRGISISSKWWLYGNDFPFVRRKDKFEFGVKYLYIGSVVEEGEESEYYLRNFSFTLSWYPRNDAKVIWNYIFADEADADQRDIFSISSRWWVYGKDSPFLSKKEKMEIIAQYSYTNIRDEEAVDNRYVQDFLLGLNWYLSRNAKISWNYIFQNQSYEEDRNVFQIRVAVDF